MSSILLLRHGETELNRSGAWRGQIDVPLSVGGQAEARALGARVAAEYHLRALYSSPLLRARQTAGAIAHPTGVEVMVDERFRDVDYGPWAGRRPADLSPEEREAVHRWARRPETPLPGAEDPASAQQRAADGLVELAGAHSGTIGIVTHDAILQLLLCQVLSIDLAAYRGLVFRTASLNELVFSASGFRVAVLNSAWHLDGGIS